MKSVEELKRMAKANILKAKMVVRCGTKDIPERLQGWREIVDSNSKSIFFLTQDRQKSECRLPRASLVDFSEDKLTLYYAGIRELNEKENEIMKEWRKITSTEEYKSREINDALTDGSSTYYQEMRFFKDKGYEYLTGLQSKGGLKYDSRTGKIIDESIKGDICMQYEIAMR